MGVAGWFLGVLGWLHTVTWERWVGCLQLDGGGGLVTGSDMVKGWLLADRPFSGLNSFLAPLATLHVPLLPLPQAVARLLATVSPLDSNPSAT